MNLHDWQLLQLQMVLLHIYTLKPTACSTEELIFEAVNF
jgi:hypothetical protein